ncbi:2,5-diamino-6-ribosylamino-4(3H)-pyrimidinone 5'-phosphate reductase [compost metagenome]
MIATTKKAPKDKIKQLKDRGIEVLILPDKDERVDIRKLIEELGRLKIDGVLLEGGGTLNFSFLEAGLVDKVEFYIAPKIIGGDKAKTPVEGVGIGVLSEAFNIKNISTKFLGEDLLIEGYLRG